MVKEHVIGQLKGTLQYVVDQEIVKIQGNKELNEQDKEKKEKKVNYLEFELEEKLEYIKKKIS